MTAPEKNGSALAGCLITFFMFGASVAIFVLLTGCAEMGALKSGAASHGARVADDSLDVAVWGVCNAQTVGAWMRRYGTDRAKSEAWRVLCGYPVTP